jgi:hypothetical protein
MNAYTCRRDRASLPELPVGRFPARTSAELEAMVAKTLAHANKNDGNTGVFAADRYFSGHAESFIARLPGRTAPTWVPDSRLRRRRR